MKTGKQTAKPEEIIRRIQNFLDDRGNGGRITAIKIYVEVPVTTVYSKTTKAAIEVPLNDIRAHSFDSESDDTLLLGDKREIESLLYFHLIGE